MLTETHADCIKKYNLIYYTVKPQAVFLAYSMPQWRSVYETNERIQYKLTKEYNINGIQRLSVYVYNI